MKFSQFVFLLCCLGTSLILSSCANFYIQNADDYSGTTLAEESTAPESSPTLAGHNTSNQSPPKGFPQKTQVQAINSASSSPAVIKNTPSIISDLSSPDSSLADSEKKNDCFEVKWLVPTSAVTVYHLRFGQSEIQMKGEVTLPIELLTKKNDPIIGPIYTYKLLCNSTIDSIYVKISSENNYGKSAYSETTKLDR